MSSRREQQATSREAYRTYAIDECAAPEGEAMAATTAPRRGMGGCSRRGWSRPRACLLGALLGWGVVGCRPSEGVDPQVAGRAHERLLSLSATKVDAASTATVSALVPNRSQAVACQDSGPQRGRLRLFSPGDGRAKGLDLSGHNGAVPWPVLKAHGVVYVFIKATQGAASIDPYFARRWRHASDCKILRGAYHFFDMRVPAERQAQHFVRIVGATRTIRRPKRRPGGGGPKSTGC